MPWATPRIWEDQELVTANLLNAQLSGNLNYLLHKIIGWKGHKPSITYGTTSASFVDVDGVNLKVTCELNGDTLLALVGPIVCSGASASAYVILDLILDSTTRASGINDGLFRSFATNVGESAFLMGVWTGLTPGSHDVKLQFRSSASGNNVQVHTQGYIHMILIET